jgi:hypothetical protein
VPVERLNDTLGHQKSVSLTTVKKHAEHCKFENLRETVDSGLNLVSVTAVNPQRLFARSISLCESGVTYKWFLDRDR